MILESRRIYGKSLILDSGVIVRGVQSAVYATEVSKAEYLTYTTEETEKMRVLARAKQLGGNMELAVRLLAEEA